MAVTGCWSRPRPRGRSRGGPVRGPPGGWRAATANPARRIWPPRGSAWPGAGAGRGSTSCPAAGTAVPWGLAPRHPPAGLPASGCRDGMRLARGQPPPGLYERLARRASGAYDSLATVCVTHAGLLASDKCFSSALTACIGIRSTAQAQRPGGRPRDPADPRQCRRYRAQGLQWGGPDRPGDDAPARTAGSRGRRGAGARDDDRRGQLGALAARATRAIIRAVGTSPTMITTSADTVWCR